MTDSTIPVFQEPASTGVDGRPLGRKGERTRRRLLEAAEQVFADLRYHDASIVKLTAPVPSI